MFDSTADSVVLFSFGIGTEKMELSVRSPVPLNNDQWHRVEAEKNIKEAVLQLNGQHRMVRPTTLQGHAKPELYSDLYVGKTCVPHMFMVPFGLMRSMLLFFIYVFKPQWTSMCASFSIFGLFFFDVLKCCVVIIRVWTIKNLLSFCLNLLMAADHPNIKKMLMVLTLTTNFPKGEKVLEITKSLSLKGLR